MYGILELIYINTHICQRMYNILIYNNIIFLFIEVIILFSKLIIMGGGQSINESKFTNKIQSIYNSPSNNK